MCVPGIENEKKNAEITAVERGDEEPTVKSQNSGQVEESWNLSPELGGREKSRRFVQKRKQRRC